ncbi:MAG TPA: glycosyltransferase family 1 protein [Chitinophagaceae bacterium]|nr:glycosyltransferase family 1 protein [Chitinophagaceae bacterium]
MPIIMMLQAFYVVNNTSDTFARNMIVAVSTRTLPGTCPEGYSYFIRETFRRITSDHPQHQFIFITDPLLKKDLSTGPNIKTIISGPQNKHPLLWKLWYDIKLPAILKRNKAAICIAAGGACTLNTKLPQILFVYDLSPPGRFYKKELARFLQKADPVVAFSAFSRATIVSRFDVDAKKIVVVNGAPHAISQPLDPLEKEKIKQQYSNGKEFFLYAGTIDPAKNLMNLLKAFSVFKKRQQSGMKLVLAGDISRNYRSFINDLKTYKYRDDVLMIENVPATEMARLMGAAYALICPSAPESLATALLDAMRCGVPVIALRGSLAEEITKGAALYSEGDDHIAIADAMMRLYKDETLRKELIQKGSAAINGYSWDKTAEQLWHIILKAIG